MPRFQIKNMNTHWYYQKIFRQELWDETRMLTTITAFPTRPSKKKKKKITRRKYKVLKCKNIKLIYKKFDPILLKINNDLTSTSRAKIIQPAHNTPTSRRTIWANKATFQEPYSNLLWLDTHKTSISSMISCYKVDSIRCDTI